MISTILSPGFLLGAVAGAVATVSSKAVYAFVTKQATSLEARVTALEAIVKAKV